jgi:hypothetical protein
MSHHPYRPPRALPTAPELFCLVFGSTFLAVPRDDAYAWWQALTSATGSDAVALRGVFMLHQIGPNSREYWQTLLCYQLRPTRLVAVTEELVEEGVLSRRVATVVEEVIFAQTTAQGGWALREKWLTFAGFKAVEH